MDKQTLTNHLNDDLAGELGAIIQYLTYAAKATGPYRPQLAQFFLAEVADEQCTHGSWPTRSSAWAENLRLSHGLCRRLIPTKKCWRPSWRRSAKPARTIPTARGKRKNLARKG